MKKVQLFKEAFVASLLMIAVDGFISFFPWKYELVKPIKQGFDDFDIYDLKYARFHTQTEKMDTGISILEIGRTRDEIAQELNLLVPMHPALIGIDAIFYKPGPDPLQDSALVAAIRHAGNVVLASKYDSGRITRSFFAQELPDIPDGFFNLPEGDEEITRHFQPFLPVNGQPYPSFSARLLQKASPGAYDTLVARGQRKETINYQGTASRYNLIGLDRFLHPVQGEHLENYIRGRVVFLGFICPDPPLILEDLHFTPMNPRQGGKSFPDTYGVVILANILEMIERGKYIDEMPGKGVYALTFALVFGLNLWYIRVVSRSRHHPHLLLFFLQLALALILVYLGLMVFDVWAYRIDLTPIIIGVVLSFEVFWLYEWLAIQMKRRFRYETFVHE